MIIAKKDLFSLDTSRPFLRPRLGFLGADYAGLSRLETLLQSGMADVAAVADACEEQREYAHMLAPRAALANSLNDLLKMNLDGIVIATPGELHMQQAVAALESGVAVFCQRPLALNVEATQQIIDTARKANRLLGVDFSYRYTSAMQAVRKTVCAGDIGKIYAVNLTFHNAFEPNQWYHNGKTSRGIPASDGCMTDLGSSLIDLAMWVLDFPEVAHVNSRLYADGHLIRKPQGQVEDYGTAQIVLQDDTVLQLACSWNLSTGCDSIIRADFYGTRGGISFHNVDGSSYHFAADRFDGSQHETLLTPLENWEGRAALEWVHRLAQGGRYHPEAERYVDVARVLEAVYTRTV